MSADNSGGRGDSEDEAGALLTHDRQGGASHIHRTEQEGLDLIPHLIGAEFLEKAGEKVPRVVDQGVDAAETRDGRLNCCLRLLRSGDVESRS